MSPHQVLDVVALRCPLRDQLGQLVPGQRLHPGEANAAVPAQLPGEPEQVDRDATGRVVAVGADQQHRRRRQRRQQVGEQVAGGAVGACRSFDDEHHRARRAARSTTAASSPSISTRPAGPSARSSRDSAAAHSRPSAPRVRDCSRSADTTGQNGGGVGDVQRAAGQHDRAAARRGAAELRHQPGLADPRVAAEEHGRGPAGDGVTQRVGEQVQLRDSAVEHLGRGLPHARPR
nr:hypothetical protein [Pseudonocardia sp. ICBG1034]